MHTALRLWILPCLVALLLDPGAAVAEVRGEPLRYQDGEVALEGYLAWDDAIEGRRPGVIVVHEWWGLNDYARRRARQLAGLGYVAFAVDMYGTGKSTEHPKQAAAWMKAIQANVGHWQRRARLGLDILRRDPRVDPGRTAAIGYCFGGATVMQMAYSGADLDGVVSFHGSLPVARADQLDRIRAKVLVLHGNADPFVPPERVTAFRDALERAGADWRMVIYGGVRHSFTNPEADSHGMEALHYDAAADRRSWREMRDFFDEIFAGP